jgi:lysophospholipase L1-like esterase
LLTDSPNIPAAINAMATLGAHANSRGVQVFIATLPPMDPAKKWGTGAPFVAPYNNQLASLAASHNWTLVDVNAAFGGNLSLLGSDGLHPTDAGYQVIAQAFYDKIVAKYDQTPALTLASRR